MDSTEAANSAAAASERRADLMTSVVASAERDTAAVCGE